MLSAVGGCAPTPALFPVDAHAVGEHHDSQARTVAPGSP
jgi:hypothetical protein